MHEFAPNFSIHKCNTLRLSESHQLILTVLVQASESREIQNVFLKTIAAAATFFIAHRGAAAASFQPR
jgi:hypothetical protein